MENLITKALHAAPDIILAAKKVEQEDGGVMISIIALALTAITVHLIGRETDDEKQSRVAKEEREKRQKEIAKKDMEEGRKKY